MVATSVIDTLGLPPTQATVHATRLDLALAFAAAGFTSGAEIGVEQGLFSEQLCQAIPGLRLHCVDAWQAYPGYREHVSQGKLDGFYRDALLRLRPYGGVTVHRGFSMVVAMQIPNRSLDFVYIDSNHSFASVVADIGAWIGKVKPGGVIAGHDYGRSSVGQVREAVQAWTSVHGVHTWWVLDGDRSPSWLWVVE